MGPFFCNGSYEPRIGGNEAREERLAHDHVVKDGAELVEGDCAPAARRILLGTHEELGRAVLECSDEGSRVSLVGDAVISDRAKNSEVKENRPSTGLGYKDILGLDVSVSESMYLEVLCGARDLADKGPDRVSVQSLDQTRQGSAVEQFHDHVKMAGFRALTAVEDADEVLVHLSYKADLSADPSELPVFTVTFDQLVIEELEGVVSLAVGGLDNRRGFATAEILSHGQARYEAAGNLLVKLAGLDFVQGFSLLPKATRKA